MKKTILCMLSLALCTVSFSMELSNTPLQNPRTINEVDGKIQKLIRVRTLQKTYNGCSNRPIENSPVYECLANQCSCGNQLFESRHDATIHLRQEFFKRSGASRCYTLSRNGFFTGLDCSNLAYNSSYCKQCTENLHDKKTVN